MLPLKPKTRDWWDVLGGKGTNPHHINWSEIDTQSTHDERIDISPASCSQAPYRFCDMYLHTYM